MGSAIAERPRGLDKEDSLPSRTVHFIPHDSFEAPGADEQILAPEPEPTVGEGDTSRGGAAGPVLAVRLALLDERQERHLFRKMNFLFFLAERLRERASLRGFEAGERKDMRRLVAEAEEIRNRLVEANLGLVVARAERFLTGGREMSDLRSEGNYALVRAVGNFDCSRNVRFSTYACMALDRTFLRFVRGGREKDIRSDSEGDGPLAGVVDYRADGRRMDAWRSELRDQAPGLLAQLGARERRIIEKRFGLDGAEAPATLKAVGSELKVSIERVRQLERKALDRLKKLAMQQGLEPFED